MQIGIDSFVGSPLDPTTGIHGSDADRVRDLLEEIELADQVGLDVYGIGEHHREEFIASAPAVLLAAAAARTSQIRLASAVTVLSSDDPVRVFQDFATLDLISGVRAGTLGLPLIVAIIGGEPHRFRPLIELYREAGKRAGHSPEKLTVGIHSVGLVADSTKQAADDLWPAHSYLFSRIGKERGWPPQTRAQFDMSMSPRNALLVGHPETVAGKILYENEALGGISRMTLMISGGALPHRKVMRAIELLGTRVAPIVRKELAQADPVPAIPSATTFSTPA